jgi:uncharacterized coiled-coil protein SlyX
MSDFDPRGDELRARLQSRLETLKAECAMGERRLAALDDERAELCRTLLRISGAVQVLQEELADLRPALAADRAA